MNPSLGLLILTIGLSPALLLLYGGFYFQCIVSYLSPMGVSNNESFEFIVVGSGSAGSVVAGRLAEAGHKVLLIEAGGPSHYIQSIPALVELSAQTPYDWKYLTEPQKHCCGAYNNRQISWSRGKVLGGSSILNYMLYVRSNPRDYDEWADMGNPGWRFEDVLPLFKKSENFHRGQEDPKFHATGGPLGVMNGVDMTDMSKLWLEAAQEAGYKIGDYNGKDSFNQTLYRGQLSVTDGKRLGTYEAFAKPFSGKTLTVLTYAHLTKVILDKDFTAVGVEVSRFGTQLQFRAEKEIILSGGSVGSPQMLLLSGIGPKEDLMEVSIPVLKNLPGVGKNLHDHTAAMLPMYSNNTSSSWMGLNSFDSINPMRYIDWFFRGRGPLTRNGVEAGGFFHSEVNKDKYKRPDIQIIAFSGTMGIDFDLGYRSTRNVADEAYEKSFGTHKEDDGMIMFHLLARPKSTGYLKLRSKDPFQKPIIQPNYLMLEEDIQTLATGLKVGYKIAQSHAFKSRGFEPMVEKFLCGDQKPFSDSYFVCMARQWMYHVYHPVGSCKMGPKSDPLAVVDHRLRVHGVKHLRVADGSIMPRIVTGNTNAAIIMIGEKAAEMILQDWKTSSRTKSGSKSKDEL